MFTNVFLNTTSNSGRPYVLKYPWTPERNIRMESHILAKVKKWNAYRFLFLFLDFWKTCVLKVYGKPRVLTSKSDGSSYIHGQHFVDKRKD